MSDCVIELERGAQHSATLLPALRDYVASAPPGDTTLVVVVWARGSQRTLRFGGLIAEPDRTVLEAMIDEHRIVKGANDVQGADGNDGNDGSAGRSDD